MRIFWQALLIVLLLAACTGPTPPPAQPVLAPAVTVPVEPAIATPAIASTVPLHATETPPASSATGVPPSPATPIIAEIISAPQAATSTVELTIPSIEIIVDNRDPEFSTSGTWWVGDGGQSYHGDCVWAGRGIQNIAYIQPALPVTGTYEIFAWWCGDPNHDQTQQMEIQIHHSRGRAATHPVYVNLQENAGQWNSLGTHYLSTNGFVSVAGGLSGNVVADAYRFVLRSLAPIEVMPTPVPTPFPWTNHPPSPLEQLTAGDLTARLGVVQPSTGYPHTPILSIQEQIFDDCATFSRPGCGGQRDGWIVQVQNRDLIVTYRISQDYRHRSIEPNPMLAERQWLYLYGSDSTRFFRVDYYAYEAHTWNLNAAYHDGTAALHLQLTAAQSDLLRTLANRYGPIQVRTEDGINLILYGLGSEVELSTDDSAALAAMARDFLARFTEIE